MFRQSDRKNSEKGFTLIELLVVIAIIGILATIVLASLNSARQRSRDAKRIGDLRSLQTALELFFDDNIAYPTDGEGLAILVTQGFIPQVPVDPLGAVTPYVYEGFATDAVPTRYVTRATLENEAHPALNADIDTAPTGATTVCTETTGGTANDFYCVVN